MKTITEDIQTTVLRNPGALTTGTTDYVDMASALTARFTLALGATDQTSDMKLVQATSAAGAGVKDVPDADIAQLSATDDNKQASIEIDPAQLDGDGGFRFVAVTHTHATGTGTTGAIWVDIAQKSKPVTAPTAVEEQVLLVG